MSTCQVCGGRGDMCPHCDGYGECRSACCSGARSAGEKAAMSELGRLVLPCHRDTCQAKDCGNQKLTEEVGAYLHRNLATDKLVILCGPCSRQAELTARDRLPLVGL